MNAGTDNQIYVDVESSETNCVSVLQMQCVVTNIKIRCTGFSYVKTSVIKLNLKHEGQNVHNGLGSHCNIF